MFSFISMMMRLMSCEGFYQHLLSLTDADADAGADAGGDNKRFAISTCFHYLMLMLMLMLMQVVTTSTEELREMLPAPALTICPTFGSMLFGFPR